MTEISSTRRNLPGRERDRGRVKKMETKAKAARQKDLKVCSTVYWWAYLVGAAASCNRKAISVFVASIPMRVIQKGHLD